MNIEEYLAQDVLESRNDITTPMDLVREIIDAIPDRIFFDGMKVLDPCVGLGNFLVGIGERAKSLGVRVDMKGVDVNEKRIEIARILLPDAIILSEDFFGTGGKFDLIVANPPYAKMNDGVRASKNHNLFPSFIEKAIDMLSPGGAIAFLVPTSWMSFASRNITCSLLSKLNIVRLDVGNAKKYFPKVGSSFSWFVAVNEPRTDPARISGKFKAHSFESDVILRDRAFLPLLCTKETLDILDKLLSAPKSFVIETTSYLHATTQKAFLTDTSDDDHPFKIVHTKKQTKWSSKPHKFQDGVKVFICLTSTYETWIDNECGMTQSVAFVRCVDREHAEGIKNIMDSVPFRFAVAVTRYGNFACIPLIQKIGVYDFDREDMDYMQKFIV